RRPRNLRRSPRRSPRRPRRPPRSRPRADGRVAGEPGLWVYSAASAAESGRALRHSIPSEGSRATPEFSFRDRFRLSRRTAVRLTRRPGGGFRLEGPEWGPTEGAPDEAGYSVRGVERAWSVRLRREEGCPPAWAEIDDG